MTNVFDVSVTERFGDKKISVFQLFNDTLNHPTFTASSNPGVTLNQVNIFKGTVSFIFDASIEAQNFQDALNEIVTNYEYVPPEGPVAPPSVLKTTGGSGSVHAKPHATRPVATSSDTPYVSVNSNGGSAQFAFATINCKEGESTGNFIILIDAEVGIQSTRKSHYVTGSVELFTGEVVSPETDAPYEVRSFEEYVFTKNRETTVCISMHTVVEGIRDGTPVSARIRTFVLEDELQPGSSGSSIFATMSVRSSRLTIKSV